MEDLIRRGIATYKRHVILKLQDGTEQHYVPGAWLGRAPFHVELRTLHVDRAEVNANIRAIAVREGVQIRIDKVISVEKGRGTASTCCEYRERDTHLLTLVSRCFGVCRKLVSQGLQVSDHEYGPSKVAIWDYFKVRDSPERTTLYGAAMDSYMEWVWQIPIREDTVSVGYVAGGDTIKRARSSGMAIPDIYRAQLNHFPALRPLLEEAKEIQPHVTSFRCRVYRKVAGPNWIIIGEAASMIDPMTSNGVTAALRQAAEAAYLVAKSRHRRRLPWRAAAAYSWRVVGLARFFNCGVERVLYDWPVRKKDRAASGGRRVYHPCLADEFVL